MIFFFYLQMSLVLSTIPQHFIGNYSTEVNLGKSRQQQHSMSTWHMDQHISHQGTAGVCLMCYDEFSTTDSVFVCSKGERCAFTEEEEPGINHRKENMPKLRH